MTTENEIKHPSLALEVVRGAITDDTLLQRGTQQGGDGLDLAVVTKAVVTLTAHTDAHSI